MIANSAILDIDDFIGVFCRTSRCGTGYRERHSAAELRIVVKRVISARGG
jgi:hypothetical protein